MSETTRKSVVETAVELGYSRITRAGSSRKICVFVQNMAYEQPDDFGWDIITGFRKLAEPSGCQVDVVPLTLELQNSTGYDAYMFRSGHQGALFLGVSFFDPWTRDFRTCTTPTVLYDNPSNMNPAVTQVGIDNDEGMELAVSRLKELGHRRIGYLSSALGSYVYQARHAAFFRALNKNKLPARKELAGYDLKLTECVEKYLPRLLGQGCTAIICSHDLLARDVMTRCQKTGIRVPEDVSIMGIDDLPICLETRPALSSIRQDRTELGKSAYYALASQIRQIHISSLKLHPEIILRGSVGPAKG